MNITVLRNVRACRLVDIYSYFRGTCCLQLQGKRVSWVTTFLNQAVRPTHRVKITQLFEKYVIHIR
jgi:hypothetical protein